VVCWLTYLPFVSTATISDLKTREVDFRNVMYTKTVTDTVDSVKHNIDMMNSLLSQDLKSHKNHPHGRFTGSEACLLPVT
jgi:hypothetical protein